MIADKRDWTSIVQGDLVIAKPKSDPLFDEEEGPVYVLPLKPLAGTGRNSPCPCKSGKKFKKCCGRARR